MTDKQEEKEKIYNIFKKYIVENNIGNTKYTKEYTDTMGITFNYRHDLRVLKRGASIPLSHLVVFCSFLNEKQKNAFLGELFNA